MWHHVEMVLTDVSEERIASIFRVEGKIRKSAREASIRDIKSSLPTTYKHATIEQGGYATRFSALLGKHIPTETNTRMYFYVVCVVTVAM
jgi:hypothetical protein